MSSQAPTAKSLRPFRYTKKNLYNLLPSIYRQRDAELGKPLEALLGVIAEQVRVVESNIDDLYENWFIETCDPWVVPYIGDLLGARLLNENVAGGAIPERAFVGNTISYRRRKGTVSMLEELSANITGWPAKVVEFFQLLETTQYTNHLRPENLRTPNIRNENTLELLGTPFDTIAHTPDVRHIDTGRGYYNIQNVGLFLYRLTAFPVNSAPAFKVKDCCFKFNVLGLDQPLFNNPVPKATEFQLAGEINVPSPIRRTVLFDGVTNYYSNGGVEKSIRVTADDSVVGSDAITVYDLSGWWIPPTGSGQVAIDPVLGRMTFASELDPTSVKVNYYYGFSDQVGGGFYERPDPDSALVTAQASGASGQPAQVYEIKQEDNLPTQFGTISAALSQWITDGRPPAIFEVGDSGIYQETIGLSLPAGVAVEIRAALEPQPQRPTLLLSSPMTVAAGTAAPNSPRASFFVNGLLIAPAPGSGTPLLSVGQGDLGALNLRHCTLVPSSAGPALEVQVPPSVSFSPSSAPLETSVTMSGSSFAPNASVALSISGEALATSPANIQSRGDGSFSAQFTLSGPSYPAGEYQVMATDSAGNKSSSTFVVTSGPVLTMSPSETSPGDQFAVAGSGFAPSSTLTLYFGSTTAGAALGTGTSDGEGSFPPGGISASVPTSAGAGPNAILVTDGTNSVLAFLWVTENNDDLTITVDHTIAGSLDLSGSEAELKVNDSIIDGGSGVAVACYQLTVQESTVFGGVQTFMVNIASNSIFTGAVLSTRRQVGCVRYCYLPPGSRVPRPYNCQPEYPEGSSLQQQEALARSAQPLFTSTRYGDPGYAQLSTSCPSAIFRGGDNGAEMGAFNELLQALRIDNLNASMKDYLRFGLEAGIFLVT